MTRTPWTLARRSFLLGAGLTALAACSSPAGVGGADAGPRGEPAGGARDGGPAAKAPADVGPRGEPAGGAPPRGPLPDVGPRGDGSPPRARFHGPAGATPPGGEPAGLEECRQALVRELTGREEGFVRDGALVAGRPVRAVLTTPVRPSPQAR